LHHTIDCAISTSYRAVRRTGTTAGEMEGNLIVIAVEIVSTRMQTDDEWMDIAACKGLTHLFFPTPAERPQARERREATAREVCASCTVRTTCRDFAREQHEYGFWGGESEDERHAAGYRLIAPIGVRARSAV
jgi:WhiB family transcriptional regulator, redox-sensing transcriptional regulator